MLASRKNDKRVEIDSFLFVIERTIKVASDYNDMMGLVRSHNKV